MTVASLHKPGTRLNPVDRDGLCAVAGCPALALQLRATSGGWWVRYCPRHEYEAHRRFDWVEETT